MDINIAKLAAECIREERLNIGMNGFKDTVELLDWYADKTEEEVKEIHRTLFGMSKENTTEEDKNSKFIGYEGVLFSHYGSDSFGAWTYVCEECLESNKQLTKHIGEENGFVCGVAGCSNSEEDGYTIRVVDIDLGVARRQRVRREKAQSLINNCDFKEQDAEDIVELIIKRENLVGRGIEIYDFAQGYTDNGIRWDNMEELLEFVNPRNDDSGFGITELWDSDYHFPLRSGVWISWRW